MSVRPKFARLDEPHFAEACSLLASEVSAVWQPDLVVGIATGGDHVAELIASALPSDPRRASVSISRPATAAKKRLRLDPMLRWLPTPAKWLLRWAEVEARELLLRRDDPSLESESLALDLPAHVGDATKILLVDDTVDSGRTLRRAAAAIKDAAPDAEIRTAVLASTWRSPPLRPDFCLFERTLIQFPWSLDARIS